MTAPSLAQLLRGLLEHGKLAVAQVTLNRARDAGVSVCNAVNFKAINPRTGKKEAAFSWTLGARWRPTAARMVRGAGARGVGRRSSAAVA